MLKKIKSFGKDELVIGSLILFIMMNLFNFLNYVFQFSMARLLGPADYGILAALMAFVYIFLIPSETIQTIITDYASRLNVKKKYGKIKELLFRSMKKGVIASVVAFIILIPVSFFFSSFLRINIYLIILINLFVFYAFIVPITRGILQGMRRFSDLGINLFLESIIKLIFAVFLVLIGWKVYGAVAAILIGGGAAFIFALAVIRDVLHGKRKEEKFKGIYSYSLPILITMISLVLMYSLDILLARRFFPPELAGKYAVIAMLGKIVLFVTLSIGKAMFPLTSAGHEKGKETRKIFAKSIKMISAISAIILALYLFAPVLVIKILFGSEYADVSNVLFIVGLAYAFLAFANLFILYGLSTNKIKKSAFFSLIFIFIQIALLVIFSSSLLGFSIALLISNLLMLIYSIIVIKIK